MASFDDMYPTSTPAGTPAVPMFDFPMDIFPYSSSSNSSTGSNSSQNTSNQFGLNASNNLGLTSGMNTASNLGLTSGMNTAGNLGLTSGATASNQFQGLDQQYRDQLLQALIPQLSASVQNMPQNIDQYTGQALGSYQQMMQEALRNNIPKAISGLANRGILNSTEGQNVLGNVQSAAATDAAGKGYETAMQNALLKANMPQTLSQIAGLGQYSTGGSTGENQGYTSGSSYGQNQGYTSGGSYGQNLGYTSGNSFGINTGESQGSSEGSNSSSGSSYQADPTVMYRTMADLLKGMM